jgi:hypothetical protein
MSIVWKLQMPRSQKVALCALLCVGLVAVAGLFYRLLFFVKNVRLQQLTINSWLCAFLLRVLPRERKGYLVLHGRLYQLV